MTTKLIKYLGSCHCGAIKFSVEAAEIPEIEDCNCSICNMSGFLHLIVPKRNFKIISGQENLQRYSFNTGIAEHLFCKTCGIKAFYIPRSNPDGVDVNLRCLSPQPSHYQLVRFDGKNWEQQAHTLAHKSK